MGLGGRLVFSVFVICLPAIPAADLTQKNILLLLPFEGSRPASNDILQGLEAGLRKNYPARVTVLVEFVRSAPPISEDYWERLFEWLSYKYRDQKIDAICPLRPESFTLAEKLRERLWPSVAIVFGMQKMEYTTAFIARPHTTGIVLDLGEEQSLRAALEMIPETQHVALVSGASPNDREVHDTIAGLIKREAPGIEVIPLVGLSMKEVSTAVRNLPEHTIIYTGQFMFDSLGRNITAEELARELSPVANSPMFGNGTLGFGHGYVGGAMNSVGHAGVQLGKLVARVLSGVPPESLAVVTVPHIKSVDWRQLKRWDIPLTRVPAGTDVQFRQRSVWEQFRVPIVAALAAFLLQALVIGFLLVERRRRRASERAARTSEELSRAILSSVSSRVAVLDKDGTVIRLSNNWTDPEQLDDAYPTAEPGKNFTEIWRKWSQTIDERENVVKALESVQDERNRLQVAEYHVHAKDGSRWVEVRVERLDRPEGGSVLTLVDDTERRKAEIDRRHTLEELHHMNRVATMGQLAGSLAHELAQPLASILANVQAAARFADRPEPNIPEIRDALAQIADDDRLAHAIIIRMRTMLKKQATSGQQADLNRKVREVSALVRNGMLMRGIQLRLELAPNALMVKADAVSLQQVVLNLINNAMDAVQELPRSQRLLTVRTVAGEHMGAIFVEDNGPGIPSEIQGRLFDSFFTTKADGLGMGLSICRSIVESLGGQISGANRPEGGAVFQITLPLLQPAETLPALAASAR
jgi:C4-dicarboxylate-specific signal transduction histidine kinase